MRLLKHLFAPSARRVFDETRLRRIAEAIAADEARHRGEICFAVEPALDLRALWRAASSRARAEEVFARLRVWDTQENNGVLIYLLLADHRIEILADRGLATMVNEEQWRGVCRMMEERLRAGDAEAAVLHGVAATGAFLAEYFPRHAGSSDRNELADRPYVLE
ncbi:MAG: hypothetical protein E6Q88_11605 [Lysobacteraceae bacterium]|nr:MAG: hypothetical protein E6Q88_11605 [Xanthomonadaceae bacterium]